MTEYICKEVQTDYGGYLEPVNPLVRCKDCRAWQREKPYATRGWCAMWKCGRVSSAFCSEAMRKEK